MVDSHSNPPHDAQAEPLQLLPQVNEPAELRRLELEQLPALAGELRRYLINTVSQTGGHLAAGLGVVELTVALHYVFNTPDDRLIWDVGHQAYPHKILTGRRDACTACARVTACPGFSSATSPSTTPSAPAIPAPRSAPPSGWRWRRKAQGRRREHIAVIGDGALSAGMAFEALNHAGALDLDLLVILNDNDMSISSPVGAISNYLARVLSSRFYNRVREGSKQVLGALPRYEGPGACAGKST